jgi:hypothetical protein
VSDYGTITRLCDVKGCGEPQTGEEVELALSPGLRVRACPCDYHRPILASTPRLVDELQRAWNAINVFWAEAGPYTVQVLQVEHPEVIELASELHDRFHHEPA